MCVSTLDGGVWYERISTQSIRKTSIQQKNKTVSYKHIQEYPHICTTYKEIQCFQMTFSVTEVAFCE
jgi:hypothetical protein